MIRSSHHPIQPTSTTLLAKLRLQPYDETSWNRFVARYGRLIIRWCLQWGVTSNDAEEITQNVMLQLARHIQKFEYDPNKSFRAWLKTVAYRAWCDFVRERLRRTDLMQNSWLESQLNSVAASHDFVRQMEREADREELEQILDLVKLRVEPQTWSAFEATALEEREPKRVADELNMSVAAVYVAKSRIIRMVRESWNQTFESDEPLLNPDNRAESG